MTLSIFNGLNAGIGVAFIILALMCVFHRNRGYRFSPKQERFVLFMAAFTFLGMGVNLGSSGIIAAVLGSSHLTGNLGNIALVTLVGKVMGGTGLWWIVFWNLVRFYPSQKRK